MIGWFSLLVDSTRRSVLPLVSPRTLAPTSSRFQSTHAFSPSLWLAFPSLSLRTLSCSPCFSVQRMYRTYSTPLAMHALAADAAPCAVKLTLSLINSFANLDFKWKVASPWEKRLWRLSGYEAECIFHTNSQKQHQTCRQIEKEQLAMSIEIWISSQVEIKVYKLNF